MLRQVLARTGRCGLASYRSNMPCHRINGQYAKRFKSSVANSTSTLVEEANERKIAYWLFGVAGLVAGMVTIGGITRLTKSGLSMTDWRVQGSLPPMNQEEWEKEFTRYKAFPEWQQRKDMTLEEFKFIFFWEYGHRMFGRFIGLAFVVPGTYFAARGMIPKRLYPRVATLFALGGGQGLIGWWMVKSGLEMDPSQKKEIRVSPYRLATHLAMAFTTYSLLVWTGLDLMNPASKMKEIAGKLSSEVMTFAKRSRKFALHNFALAAVTVLSGAYVAGNDAGRAYNTFPKMGDTWVPDGLFELTPLYRNFFENTALVQLDHRILALSTLTAIGTMHVGARRALAGAYWKALPSSVKLAYNSVAIMSVAQVSLGISTLLLYVPTELAVTHQVGALTLLTLVTGLVHSLGFAKYGAVKAGGSMQSTAKIASALLSSNGVKLSGSISAVKQSIIKATK